MAYTFFESDAVSFVEAPIVPGGGGAVGSLVHHPGAAIIASAGPVRGEYEIDFQLAEIEYRRLLVGDAAAGSTTALASGTPIWSRSSSRTGVFGGSPGRRHQHAGHSDFDGGGACSASTASGSSAAESFSLYGNAGVSPVVGQFYAAYSMYNESTDVLLAERRWKDDRFVTILDYEVGLAWTSCSGCLRLSAGYMAQFWYNTITTPELVDAVRATNYTDVGRHAFVRRRWWLAWRCGSSSAESTNASIEQWMKFETWLL